METYVVGTVTGMVGFVLGVMLSPKSQGQGPTVEAAASSSSSSSRSSSSSSRSSSSSGGSGGSGVKGQPDWSKGGTSSSPAAR